MFALVHGRSYMPNQPRQKRIAWYQNTSPLHASCLGGYGPSSLNKQTYVPWGSEDIIKRPRRDLSRIEHTIHKMIQNGDSRSHKISKRTAEYQPLCLVPKLVLGGLWTVIIFLRTWRPHRRDLRPSEEALSPSKRAPRPRARLIKGIASSTSRTL